MRAYYRKYQLLGALVVCAGLLSACGGQGGEHDAMATAAVSEAQYQTQAGHYRELQRAGLTGNYTSFAKHLSGDATDTLVTALNQAFGGRPFDVYTWKAEETQAGLRRLVELRSSSGRLYLFVQLDRVPGGWNVSRWDISRNRAAITAQL